MTEAAVPVAQSRALPMEGFCVSGPVHHRQSERPLFIGVSPLAHSRGSGW